MQLLQIGLIITEVIFIISIDGTLGCGAKPPRIRCSQRLPTERAVAEYMARNFDSRYLCFTLSQLCSYICYTDWSDWSRCTKPCGGGTQYRTRSRQYVGGCRGTSHTCVESGTRQTRQCNTVCPNGGSPSSAGCSCHPAYKGRCCTEEVTCRNPVRPHHGQVQVRSPIKYGVVAKYTCNEGYHLYGSETSTCSTDGKWSTSKPECRGVICPPVSAPLNGKMYGSSFLYGDQVMFQCNPGYQLVGSNRLKCIALNTVGAWMGNVPTCEEIRCKELFTPQPHGLMESCDNKVNSQCQFGCIDGFIIIKGSSVRTCQESGDWDGRSPQCTACPKDTYKSTNRSCLPCPANSGTKAVGSTLEDCVCNTGYSGPGGGPCKDIDECMANNGTGPCEDTCENQEGSYACRCTRPGYELEEDEHTCYATQECKNLTKEDAPENGGLVCHWYRKQSSQICSVMCNDGYEFPSRPNYETCGPSTGYNWTHKAKDPKAVFAPCIEEFLPGFHMVSDAAYFTTACDELSENDTQEVYKNFKERLDNASVCMTRKSKVCSIEDMGIICGKRTKRDIGDGKMQVIDQVDLQFKVKSLKLAVSPKDDCKSNICPMLRIPDRNCTISLCVSAYKRYLKAAVLYAKRQLTVLFQNKRQRNKLQFNAGGRRFSPKNQVIMLGEVKFECPLGMVANKDQDKCIPCDSGTFWNSTSTSCDPCPINMYQPFKNTTLCLKCPPGSHSSEPGAILCSVCPPGFYGDQCQEKCACVNGTCDAENGTCQCQPGFEGKYCETDIDGCADVNCYPGVPCIDAPAPATGSSCGPCPPGLAGDGAVCQRKELRFN